MNFAFRLDASLEIGTGHYGRCFTLANKIVEAGHYVLFICRHIPKHLMEQLQSNGFDVLILKHAPDKDCLNDLYHSSWLEVSQERDAKQCINGLKDLDIYLDWLIVDHYALDARWENKLRPCARNICVIDDLADRIHNCDALIDQNFYKNKNTRYLDLVPKSCNLMLGPEFAILRDEFKNLKKSVKAHNGTIGNITIFFGGSDKDNFTGFTINALGELGLKKTNVNVVVGKLHPDIKMLKKQCKEYGYKLHIQSNKIASIFLNSDLCIGGGGVITWERCCLGLPSIIISISMNQIQIAKDLDEINGCSYIGESSSITKETIQVKITQLMKNEKQLKEISETAYALVDGLGSDKITAALVN